MQAPQFEDIAVDQEIGPLTLPPIDRLALALYCGASHDHNPIHVDPDAARRAGLDDVIAHGMLSMAYLGRLLMAWAPQRQLRSFSCRFIGMMHVGDVPVLTGAVSEKRSEGGETLVRVALTIRDAAGNDKAVGETLIAAPARGSDGGVAA